MTDRPTPTDADPPSPPVSEGAAMLDALMAHVEAERASARAALGIDPHELRLSEDYLRAAALTLQAWSTRRAVLGR